MICTRLSSQAHCLRPAAWDLGAQNITVKQSKARTVHLHYLSQYLTVCLTVCLTVSYTISHLTLQYLTVRYQLACFCCCNSAGAHKLYQALVKCHGPKDFTSLISGKVFFLSIKTPPFSHILTSCTGQQHLCMKHDRI